MEKSPAVSFTSSQFPVEPNEDEDTNPGIYGRALACWLAEQLAARGWLPRRWSRKTGVCAS